MLLMAHTGITLGAAYILDNTVKRKSGAIARAKSNHRQFNIDYSFVLLGSLLPDLIDKPLGLLLSNSGRSYAHTALFFIFTVMAAIVINRVWGRRWGFYMAFGVAMHFILDSIWLEPAIFLWPFCGADFPVYPNTGLLSWVQRWFDNLIEDPWIYVPEIIGSVILLSFAIVIITKGRIKEFLLTGTF